MRTNPDLNDPNILAQYHQMINANSQTLLDRHFNENDIMNNQKNIDQIYNDICQMLSTSYDSLSTTKTIPQSSKSNEWFTSELKEIKNQISFYKHRYANDDKEFILKELKKKFRSLQRRNIWLNQLNEMKKFELIAKQKDKTLFWKYVNKKKNKVIEKSNVTLNQETLTQHFEKLFNEPEDDLTVDQHNITKIVEFNMSNYKHKNEFIFSIENIKQSIHDVKTSKLRGFDNVSYEMKKAIENNNQPEAILKFLYKFFNQIYISRTIPTDFNTSIIKPILKDSNKKSDDVGNIRPISISNCFAQIFEKLILLNSPKISQTSKNQFGFKQKTSCNHIY